MGGYDETPCQFAQSMYKFIEVGINMIGGCCGTNHHFIKELHDTVKHAPVRKRIESTHWTWLSGMEEFVFYDNINFVNIGERCNLAGSLAFKRLIKNEDWEKAAEIAKQ